MHAIHRSTLVWASAGFLLVALVAPALAVDARHALQAKATVSESDARATALARVGNGTIRSAELEKEHGALVWSFDIARSNTKGVTEVQVDAKTGKVVSVNKESPTQEAREAKIESRAGK